MNRNNTSIIFPGWIFLCVRYPCVGVHKISTLCHIRGSYWGKSYNYLLWLINKSSGWSGDSHVSVVRVQQDFAEAHHQRAGRRVGILFRCSPQCLHPHPRDPPLCPALCLPRHHRWARHSMNHWETVHIFQRRRCLSQHSWETPCGSWRSVTTFTSPSWVTAHWTCWRGGLIKYSFDAQSVCFKDTLLPSPTNNPGCLLSLHSVSQLEFKQQFDVLLQVPSAIKLYKVINDALQIFSHVWFDVIF